MTCKKCGHENPPGTIYCSNCGYNLSWNAPPPPGVGSSLSHGWRVMWQNFWGLFLSVFIYYLFTVAIVFASWFVYYRFTHNMFYFDMAIRRFALDQLSWEFELVILGISVFILIPLIFGVFSLFLGPVRGEKIKFGRILDGFRNYPSVVLVGVTYYLVLAGVFIFIGWLMEVIIGLGVILLIAWLIVSIVLMCKLVFVPFLITDRKMKGFNSIRESWRMSSGHAGQAFGIGVVMVLVALGLWLISWLLGLAFGSESITGGYIALAIMLLFLMVYFMWYISAFTSLYYAVGASDRNS